MKCRNSEESCPTQHECYKSTVYIMHDRGQQRDARKTNKQFVLFGVGIQEIKKINKEQLPRLHADSEIATGSTPQVAPYNK